MAATRSLSTEIGIQPACHALGLARSGFYRGQGPATAPAPRPSPPRTLSSDERPAVLATVHSDRFVDTAPATVYATLLDEGRYHCSIRTLYRILDEQAEVKERRNQLRHPVYQKPELLATAPPSGVVLGSHETRGPRDVVVRLPLCQSGYLQPVRGRLDGRPGGVGGAGPAAHHRHL